MFFNSLLGLLRVIVVGALAYALLIVVLRLSGKRTLSKMNAFDLVVTVALGSTLATVLLSKDVALAEGALAFALLAFLQFSVAWLSARSRKISELVKSQPKLLFYRGRFQRDEMKTERVAEEEVRQAIRAQGTADIENVEAVVLETDGSFSVITNSEWGRESALDDVGAYPGQERHSQGKRG